MKLYQYKGNNYFIKPINQKLQLEIVQDEYYLVDGFTIILGHNTIETNFVAYIVSNSTYVSEMNESQYKIFIANKLKEKYNISDDVVIETDSTLTDTSHLVMMGVRIRKHNNE